MYFMPKGGKSPKSGSRGHSGNFYNIVPSVIFSVFGLIYLLVPYDALVAIGIDLQETHESHLLFGAVFLALAAGYWYLKRVRGK